MFTKYQNKDGTIFSVVSQQYQVGTYFIVNNDSRLQGGSDLKEEDFHKDLRKNLLKSGKTLLDGSYIVVEKKGKYDINNFKEK